MDFERGGRETEVLDGPRAWPAEAPPNLEVDLLGEPGDQEFLRLRVFGNYLAKVDVDLSDLLAYCICCLPELCTDRYSDEVRRKAFAEFLPGGAHEVASADIVTALGASRFRAASIATLAPHYQSGRFSSWLHTSASGAARELFAGRPARRPRLRQQRERRPAPAVDTPVAPPPQVDPLVEAARRLIDRQPLFWRLVYRTEDELVRFLGDGEVACEATALAIVEYNAKADSHQAGLDPITAGQELRRVQEKALAAITQDLAAAGAVGATDSGRGQLLRALQVAAREVGANVDWIHAAKTAYGYLSMWKNKNGIWATASRDVVREVLVEVRARGPVSTDAVLPGGALHEVFVRYLSEAVEHYNGGEELVRRVRGYHGLVGPRQAAARRVVDLLRRPFEGCLEVLGTRPARPQGS